MILNILPDYQVYHVQSCRVRIWPRQNHKVLFKKLLIGVGGARGRLFENCEQNGLNIEQEFLNLIHTPSPRGTTS